MKRLFLYAPFLLLACGFSDCPSGINKLPMYGRAKKCKEQIEFDNNFLKGCDRHFGDRRAAAKHHVNRGWGYFYRNEFDTAMMRFNQAWLLDSMNADVYWGFGNILGLRDKKYKESLLFFERSLKLNRTNPRVWQSAATSYGQLFYATKNRDLLDSAITYLKQSTTLKPDYAQAYAQLTTCYVYFVQKDSARKYLRITDTLDPMAINPGIRKIVTEK
jgi:tetratricopeptide (TPR) repeat protein